MSARTPATGDGVASAALRLGVERVGTAAVVSVAGELDVAGEAELGALVRSATELPGIRALALDLGACTFCDVRGLAGIVTAARAARSSGLAFGLVEVPEHVQRLAGLAGFDGQFPRPVDLRDLLTED